VAALDLRTGRVVGLSAPETVLATGGHARAWSIHTNTLTNTGDGLALALGAGAAAVDLEMLQFHPTGLYPSGVLLSEACRGEGGHLKNRDGERFMARYAPEAMELAPRDVVTRAEHEEIEAGRGAGEAGDALLLDLRHLGAERIRERLPEVQRLTRSLVGLDPIEDPLPIRPTAHYAMGGLAVDLDGRVYKPDGSRIDGLRAAGECACSGMHGANRLGANSLLEASVLGRRAGRALAGSPPARPSASVVREAAQALQANLAVRLERDGVRVWPILERLGEVMTRCCGVARDEAGLTSGLEAVARLRREAAIAAVADKASVFNYELVATFEAEHLTLVAEATLRAALAREDSRGAHVRRDHGSRDDARFARRMAASVDRDGRVTIGSEPVERVVA
jgi:succinate dehydrogenase / fumarate reductase flavoprotein subunit